MDAKYTGQAWNWARLKKVVEANEDQECAYIVAACNAYPRLMAEREELVKALRGLVSTARTFRNVPKDEQEWTTIDDDALNNAFDLLARLGAE